MSQGIPFLIGLVADTIPPNPAATAEFIDYLECLHHTAPQTPFVILSRLASDGELALAQAARKAGFEVWHLGDDGKVGAGGTALASRQIMAPPIPETLPSDISSARWKWELAWLCRHCNVLVTLVDDASQDMAKVALQYRLYSLPKELGGTRGVLFAPETGPAVKIAPGKKLKSHPPPGEFHDTLTEQLKELDQFNRMAIQHRLTADACPLRKAIAEGDQPIVSWHCVADALSRAHQEVIKRWFLGIFAISIVAVVGLQILGVVLPGLPLADIYALFFFGLGSIYFWYRQHPVSDRYADYRVLAEALRVQIFWRQAGLPDSVAEAFMHKHRARLAWVREALKCLHLLAATIPEARPDECLSPWIKQQASYHEASRLRHANLNKYLGWGIYACYFVSFVLTLLIFLPTSRQSLPPALLEWCSALLGILASCGTLLLIYRGSMGFAQRAAMGERLSRLFTATRDLFKENKIPNDEKTELIRDLGREVLLETGEWIFIEGPS